jgi:hypothetical protein
MHRCKINVKSIYVVKKLKIIAIEKINEGNNGNGGYGQELEYVFG